jgi:hypothetical protein
MRVGKKNRKYGIDIPQAMKMKYGKYTVNGSHNE